MTKTGNKMRLSVLAFSIMLLVALAASGTVQAQTGTDGLQNTLTVLTVDSEDKGVTFIARWHDASECDSQYAIYIGGVDTGLTSLPEGAAVSGAGYILAGTAESTAALMSVNFQDFSASDSVDALSVSVFCGDASTGRLVAEVNDIPVDADSGRPVEGAYSGELTLDLGLDGAIGFSDTFDPSDTGLRAVRTGGQAQDAGDTHKPNFFGPVIIYTSYMSTTVANSGATGSTFTITFYDDYGQRLIDRDYPHRCHVDYELYMDKVDPIGVGLPSGATQHPNGPLDERYVHLGSVAQDADPHRLVVTFSSIKAVSGSDHLVVRAHCASGAGGTVFTARASVRLPVNSTSRRPVPGTYSSAPGITGLQIGGVAQTDFDPYKTERYYTFHWNVGQADQATIKPVLKAGYSATFYGSSKRVMESQFWNATIATWTTDYEYIISDANATQDGFQLRFVDNDPKGTDTFRMRVSRGDYDPGHEYEFFVIRQASVAGPTTPDYAENGTDAIGTYTISDPDRDYNWRLESFTEAQTGEGEEDDRDAFSITKNDDGNGVLSFAFSPDYEAPTDGSSPPDNVYHTSVTGFEVDRGLWYGNYYGTLGVQVTVTDVDEVDTE